MEKKIFKKTNISTNKSKAIDKPKASKSPARSKNKSINILKNKSPKSIRKFPKYKNEIITNKSNETNEETETKVDNLLAESLDKIDLKNSSDEVETSNLDEIIEQENLTQIETITTKKNFYKEIDLNKVHEVITKKLKLADFYDKWPLIIDETKEFSSFCKENDTVYVNCGENNDLVANILRYEILTAFYYEKILVFDLDNQEFALEKLKTTCNEIDKNLFMDLCNKTISKNKERCKCLIKKSDGNEFLDWKNFNSENNMVIFITSKIDLIDAFSNVTIPYLVKKEQEHNI